FVSEAPIHFTLPSTLQLLFMGVSTAVAYSAWNHGIQRGNMTLLATASYFTPVLSALIASLWLGLHPGWAFWQGVIMVVAGSLLCWLATRRYG
ncbi:EamA family transporter, partial [Buttiauxella noackiae]